MKKNKTLGLNVQEQIIFYFLFDDPVKQSNTDDNIQNDQTMNTTNENTRKSTRIRKILVLLNDYYHNVVRVFNDRKAKYLIYDAFDNKNLSQKCLCYSLALCTSYEANSYAEVEKVLNGLKI